MINKTEYGEFQITELAGVYLLSLVFGTRSVVVGKIVADSGRRDVRIILNKLATIYLGILRIESKYQLFRNMPLSNPFKDAVLRAQLEVTGETRAVIDIMKTLIPPTPIIIFPDIADDLDISTNPEFFLFRTPYGIYRMVDDTLYCNDEFISNANGYPFSTTGHDLNIARLMMLLCSLEASIEQKIKQKSIEIMRLKAETLKYIFGYDTLRRAIRIKGMR